MSVPHIFKGKKMNREWWESKYFAMTLLALWGIAWWIWGGWGFLLGFLVGVIWEDAIAKADLKRRLKSCGADIEWLRERLRVVDPSSEDDWLCKNYETLKPPPDEVVGHCPKCDSAIQRSELARRYNGGHGYTAPRFNGSATQGEGK